jgi:hypothetical protein
MRWYFRDISDDPSEKELTQLDQFNNDEVALSEALVRETIQNSTDAQAPAGGPVRVRFAVGPANDADYFRSIVHALEPHLRASKIPAPAADDAVNLLVVEDFGTTGLTGSVSDKDDDQFSGFWRRFGRSNKKEGTKGGRWGLGKLVFPSASAARIVIGLTQRPRGEDPIKEDGKAWLMGQAILRNHSHGDEEHDSVGFWCRDDAPRKGLPTDDADRCAAIAAAAGLRRGTEPGLSLIIPYLLPEIKSELLIEAAIKNYYFPILTGKLAVEIDGRTIDAATFDAVAASLAGAVSPAMLAFVHHLQRRKEQEADVTLPPNWDAKSDFAGLLGADAIDALREKLKRGELVHVTAPLTVHSREDGPIPSQVDAFLKAAQPGEKPQTLVVRGSITVPAEGKRMAFPDCHAALLAEHPGISGLLGDSENPAHTKWDARALKLRTEWVGGYSALRKVRAVVPAIYELVSERIEREDRLALVDFFSIPRANRPSAIPKTIGGRPEVTLAAQAKAFRIEKRPGGFAVLPGPGIEGAQFPLKLHVRCAYDVLTGNPFTRFSDYDFNFFVGSIRIEKHNALCWPTEANEIDLEVHKLDFKVEIVGFDSNRDLVIEAQD